MELANFNDEEQETNESFEKILVVIGIIGKYGWATPIKNKCSYDKIFLPKYACHVKKPDLVESNSGKICQRKV